MSAEDGESAYNINEASIERYDNGFLVVPKANGIRSWYPDSQIRNAKWELAKD